MFSDHLHACSERPSSDDFLILAHGGAVVVRRDQECIRLPRHAEIADWMHKAANPQLLGMFKGHRIFAAADAMSNPDTLPASYCREALRDLLGVFSEEEFRLCGLGLHLAHWDRTHAFCGRCGCATLQKDDERAKVCPACGNVCYPRISPAAIMGVVRNNQILLARNINFKAGMHSVLAGFVEAGETLEECVAREVLEETQIVVKNIRYVGSQPWPFPDSLMIAFMADYERGEIVVDQKELIEAGWFSVDELPFIPGPGTAARMLIDHFLEQNTALR